MNLRSVEPPYLSALKKDKFFGIALRLLAVSILSIAFFVTQLLIASAFSATLSNDSDTLGSYYGSAQSGRIIGAVLTPPSGWSDPVQVESAEFLLYQFSGAVSSATVRIHVHAMNGNQPGTLLGSSAPVTITTLYPAWASVSLTSANIILPSATDPFMVAVEYMSGANGSTPGTMMDNQDNISTGKNFYSTDGGATWREHYDFWGTPETIGHNMIRATLEVPDPRQNVEFVGRSGAPIYAGSLVMSGTHVYVGDSVNGGGLHVISITNPFSPTEVGFADYGGAYINDLAVSGTYVYLLDGWSDLHVTDITDPGAPQQMGSTIIGEGGGDGIAISGTYAYVAYHDGPQIVDISDTANPSTIAGFDKYSSAYTIESPNKVALSGSYAYIAVDESYFDAGDGGLWVLDVSDPLSPTEVTFYNVAGSFEGIAIQDSLAYVAAGDFGLRIISITNPLAPTEIGFFNTPGTAEDVAVSGSLAYVADGNSGLRVIDISDPANPTEVGYYDTPGYASGVAVQGDYIYVADGGGSGLFILSYVEPTYSITGQVIDDYGNPIPEVIISMNTGLTATTNNSGYYTFTEIISGTYKLTPAHDSYRFSPPWDLVEVKTGAIAETFEGTFQRQKFSGTVGYLTLSVSQWLSTIEPIAPSGWVVNPSDTLKNYNAKLFLFQNNTTLDVQTQNVTVSPDSFEILSTIFNFGTYPEGDYQIRIELWWEDKLISTETDNIWVILSDDQEFALIWINSLTKRANQEYDQGAELVVKTNFDSINRMGEKLFSKLASNLLGWVRDLGYFVDLDDSTVNYAVDKISIEVFKELFGLSDVIESGSDYLLSSAIQNNISSILQKPRAQVEANRLQAEESVVSQGFLRSEGLIVNLRAHDVALSHMIETKPISGIKTIIPPYGETTLSKQRVTWDAYDTWGRALSALVLAASVGIILIYAAPAGAAALATVSSGFLSLAKTYSLVSMSLTGLLGLIAIGMTLQFEAAIIPAITQEHSKALDIFQSTSQMSASSLFNIETELIESKGHTVSLITNLENDQAEMAEGVLETFIYSSDGRVTEIATDQVGLDPGQSKSVNSQMTLPPDTYKTVSTFYTNGQFQVIDQIQNFEVTNPQVKLDVSLADSHLLLGEAMHATIFVTNTSLTDNTGDITIFAASTDGQHFDTWTVNIAPGDNRRLDYSFAPQADGSYILQAVASDGYSPLAAWDVAYVVGNGSSTALNHNAQSHYAPDSAVTIPLTLINAGNVSTSTTVSLITLDLLNDLAPIYTDTLSLNIDAESSISATMTALPTSLIQPGLYIGRLLLSGRLYTNFDFSVTAEDTLYGDIYPDTFYHNVGDSVTLNVDIFNSVFTTTEAQVNVDLLTPDGDTQKITMSPVGTGRYQGAATLPLTGTYEATLKISKTNHRTVGGSITFRAGNRSQLMPVVSDYPIIHTTNIFTLNVQNEHGRPISGARAVISGTTEYISGESDKTGQMVFYLSPVVTEPYRITLEKEGFAKTVMNLPVIAAPDTSPPDFLVVNAPFVTNKTPLIINGATEVGANVSVNGQTTPLDSRGQFTTTFSLTEGENIFNIAATDANGNTTTRTRSVTLDTVPPSLSRGFPPEEIDVTKEVISVVGNTEPEAIVKINDDFISVESVSGNFEGWALLQPGVNTVTLTSVDEAENVSAISSTVTFTPNVVPIMVEITGTVAGAVNTDYSFTATVNPISTTQPITYMWQATDQSESITTANALSQSVTFTWPTSGTKAITVTATNAAGTVTDTHTITISAPVVTQPPSTVAIAGPITGLIETAYSFTATVGPISTTQPITYVWQATDQSESITTANVLSHSVAFTWSTTGTKALTVTASNAAGTVTDTHTITVSAPELTQPPSAVAIAGPITGLIETAYNFTATVSPISTTQPITYVWQATDQSESITTANALSHNVAFTWPTTGTKAITVTAINAAGTVTDTHTITVSAPELTQPPSAVAIAGPITGLIGIAHSFTATVGPISTTQPITYVWQATDQSESITTANVLSHSVAFTWSTAGTKALTVTASNAAGTVTDTHTITVSAPELTQPPSAVTIAGPIIGLIETTYSFTATVSPISTTQPITYVWQATDQSESITTANVLSHSVAFTWSTAGTKALTVTASNAAGTVTDTHTITVSAPELTQPPSAVAIAGPIIGLIETTYSFTATVSPISTTQPITYVWQATDQSESITTADALSHSVAFTWSTTGTKAITVTATNAAGTVTDTHTITVSVAVVTQPPSAVTIAGPITGLIETTYSFTATVSPISTTQPITYVWQAAGQSESITTANALSHSVAFTWSTTGTKAITVTATNAAGTVTDTHTITVSVAVVTQPPSAVTIAGPITGLIETTYSFTATVSPISTTQPITYVWQAAGQSESITTANALSHNVAFTWSTTGTKAITVTAINAAGTVTDTHAIAIGSATTAEPPNTVEIVGPMTGTSNKAHIFTASVGSISTTLPLTYTWQATDQEELVSTVSEVLTNSVVFTWTTTGFKAVTSTVTNQAGSVRATTGITITPSGSSSTHPVYLPLVLK